MVEPADLPPFPPYPLIQTVLLILSLQRSSAIVSGPVDMRGMKSSEWEATKQPQYTVAV